MTARTRIVVLSALAVAGLLAAVVLGARPAGPPPAQDQDQGAPVTAAAPTPLACAFVPGQQAAFHLESAVEARGVAQASPRDRVQTVLSWQVLADARPGEWLLRAALSSTELSQQLSSPAQRLGQPLDGAFIVRLGRDCRFLGTGYAREWQPATRRFVTTLLSTFEFALGPGVSWELEQGDGMGRYTARYAATRLADGSAQLQKMKARYRDDARQKGGGIQVQVVNAKASATLDAAGRWLQRASGTEQVRLSAQGSLLADLEQRFELRRDDGAFVPPDERVEAAALDWQDPFLMPTQVATSADPALLALPLDGALERFAAAYRKTAGGDALAAARFLAAWLQVHPEEAAALLARVRRDGLPEALRPAAFLALELCGTPQARAVLSSAVGDQGLAEMDRARAASALSDVPQPTPESARALVKAAGEPGSKLVSGGSVRALGHLLERTDALDPALHEELRTALRGALHAASDPSREVDVVDAIGNSGDEAFAPELGARLGDAAPPMREHAARALRRMEAPVAGPLLLERLKVEGDSDVRTALVDTLAALGVRDPSSLAVGAQLLPVEGSPNTRAALIRWLGAAADVPVARQGLIAWFHREQVPQLLQLIGRYLPVAALQ
jgi:hypothetical protein